MSGTPTLNLNAAELGDLAAAARAQGLTPAALAARIVREWIGPARIATVDQRAIAARRLAQLEAWWADRSKPAGVSVRTLQYWQLRYQGTGLAGLADRRYNRRPRPDRFAAFNAELVRVYRSTRRANLAICYRSITALARQRGWAIPSLRTAGRTLARHAPLPAGGKDRRPFEGRSIDKKSG